MNAKLRRIAVIWGVPVVLGAAAGVVGSTFLPESAAAQAERQAKIVPPVHFTSVNVTLPAGTVTFPPGPGSEIANANCVMCHSTGMVLHQPPLTVGEWTTEINKMRAAFGAPISADQVDQLAHYLNGIDGRKSDGGPSGVDKQAS
jgi:mono/diheme cytochrome c family protein